MFAANGLAFAAFIARTPAIRDTFGLSSAQLGLLLLCLSAGAVAGLPLSGPIVHRFGPARAVLLGVLTVTAGMAPAHRRPAHRAVVAGRARAGRSTGWAWASGTSR